MKAGLGAAVGNVITVNRTKRDSEVQLESVVSVQFVAIEERHGC